VSGSDDLLRRSPGMKWMPMTHARHRSAKASPRARATPALRASQARRSASGRRCGAYGSETLRRAARRRRAATAADIQQVGFDVIQFSRDAVYAITSTAIGSRAMHELHDGRRTRRDVRFGQHSVAEVEDVMAWSTSPACVQHVSDLWRSRHGCRRETATAGPGCLESTRCSPMRFQATFQRNPLSRH